MCAMLPLIALLAVSAHTAVCSTSLVGKRTGHSLAYDAQRRQVVMFGGSSDDDAYPYPRSLWAWNGDTWECVDDHGPPGRRDAFLSYDVRRKRLVLFGGRVISSDRQMRFLRDTWEWDGAAWKQVDSAGPAPRIHAATAYDARLRGVVVHGGGIAADQAPDTWVWTGASWDSLPLAAPRGVGNSMFATPSGTLVLSALRDSSSECTRLMRAQLFALRDNALVPIGAKGPCYSPQAPAASTANGILLFASWEPGNASMTWLFANGEWRRAETSSPPRRRGSQAAYDEARRRVVVFGGDDDNGLLGDTWEWTGTSWIRRS